MKVASKIKIFGIVLIALILIAPTVNAAIVKCGTKSGAECKIGDLLSLVVSVINFLLGFAGLVAITYIFIGGARLIFSAGSPDQAKAAKTTLFNAILGFILTIGAYLIINITLQLLRGQSTDLGGFIMEFWR